ncbi:unnamed protein product [Moneuplotes crassus]|uniref:Uncharacterized protein n=1 Tax=Euplotes crassus TaxID=5936 RepID=A0AAD1U7A6_EUPCR|nr:unnamed protein product [Moneuplotes crassus]
MIILRLPNLWIINSSRIAIYNIWTSTIGNQCINRLTIVLDSDRLHSVLSRNCSKFCYNIFQIMYVKRRTWYINLVCS